MAKKKAPKAPLLQPVFIPDMEPVFEGDTEGAAGGIGLRNVESNLVVYLINPKDGVGAGSVATLYWTNQNVPVASTPIREEDVDQALIPLTVPQHNVVEFWANPVFAKLRRHTGNTSNTEEIKVRVRLNRPGGDPGPGPGHKGLMYEIPPGVVLNGVSEAVAQAGVKITIRYWQYMRPYDLIRLVWGSRTVEHRVQPGEEGRDIVVNVDYETIKAAGNNPLTRVAHQVRDAGGNLPAEGARWSVSTWIDVHLSEVRPEAPWLTFPDTHPNRIDLSELGSWDVEVQIWVTSAETGAFSHVTLIWDGKDSEGNPIPHTSIKTLDGPGPYPFTVDNALVAAIADGTASVHALYQRAGGEQPSQKLYLEIFGHVIRWPAPKIREDLGGHLDPAFNATVYFPLQGSWTNDGLIEVVFRVSSPDNSIEFRIGREVDDVPPNPAGELEFTVPAAEVKRFEGHVADVFYAFTRAGSNKPQESLRLQIVVGVLVRTMPVPIIAKAIAGQLNPDDITDYAKVFSTYTETLRSDWIRMFWIGPRARAEVPVQVAVNGTTTEHDFDKSYLTNNLNEKVAVFYSLTRGTELPRYSQITEVLISRYLGDLPAPTLLGADVTGPNTADLEPLKVQTGTQLLVTYTGMRDDDSIKVTVVGTSNGGSPDIPSKFGNQTVGMVAFDFTAVAIAANIRSQATPVKFHYVVTRADTPETSATLTVTVKPIPVTELAKTVIKLNEANATTKVLDLSTFTGNATAYVGIWPFIINTRPVWLRFLGKTASNVKHDRLLFNGAGSSAVNPNWISTGKIEWPLPREYLEGLGHNTELTVEFKAAFSASKVEAEAVAFPLVQYRVNTIQMPVEFPVPTLTQATVTGATTATLAPLSAQTGGTVSVQFTPMYTTDKIKVTMTGTAGAGSPVIAEKNGLASGAVTFAIPKTAIAANIGNANKTFTLKYEVTRENVTRPSVLLTVTVTPIPVNELQKTILRINQANQTTKVLDVSAVASGGTLRVGSWPFIAQSQRVAMVFNGFTANDTPHNLTVWTMAVNAVTADWFSNGFFEEVIPASYFSGLGHNKTLSLQFKVSLNGTNVEANAIAFPLVTYTVNSIPAQFPVPKLVQATGTGTAVTLAAMNGQNGGTVSVQFTPMYTTDSIKVTMVGTAGAGSPAIAAKAGLVSGVVTFDIPKTAIAANIGNANKTFTLKYEVTRANVTIPSVLLTVTVTPIPQAELLKTVMQILQANQTTKVLDLSTVTAGATTRVGVWAFITSPFPVWLKLTGQKNDGTAITPIVVWNGAGGAAVNPNWIAAGFLNATVAYNSLKDLGHGKKLTMEFKAAMSTSKVEADAIVFPVVEYTINSLPAQFPVPKLTQATGSGTSVTLAPLSAQTGGTVSVQFTPMYTTDKIKVTMVGTAGAGSPVIAEKNGLASGVQTFDIPKAAIAANIGNANKTFTLKYEVTRGGVTRPSATLTVTVTPIPVTELQKTVLRINQASQTTKILDLSAVASGGTLRVGSWPFIAQSQRVAMVFTGFTANNTPHNRTVWTMAVNAVTAGWFSNGFFEELIPASYFSGLGRNKTLSLLFKVSLNGTTAEANAITFTTVNYTIADTRPPSLSIAPTVNEADPYNNALSLLKPINGVTVVVPHYAGMWVGDDITLVWSGGSTGSQGKKVTGLGAQSISVSQSVINQSIGKTLNFSYNVKREGGTVASPASPTFSIAVQNPVLTGTVRFSSGTTSYYRVTPTSTHVSVPSSTPNNAVVARTNQLAASAETRGTGTNWNMGNVNLIGPQPSTASSIFPTNVKGIGMRFVRYTIPTNSSDYFNGGGLGPNTNGEASNGVNPLQRRMHVEFIKVGPVTSGTIAAGYIMQRVAGSNRLHFLGVQLMSAITFTAT